MRFFERETYARSVEKLTGERPLSAVVLVGRTNFRIPRHLVRTATQLLLMSPSFTGLRVRAVVDRLDLSDVTAHEGESWSAFSVRGCPWFVRTGYEPRYQKDDLRQVLAPRLTSPPPSS